MTLRDKATAMTVYSQQPHSDACWDDDLGACWWVEVDLCSGCAGA